MRRRPPMRQAGGKSFQGEGGYFWGGDMLTWNILEPCCPPFNLLKVNSPPKNKAELPTKNSQGSIWVPGLY